MKSENLETQDTFCQTLIAIMAHDLRQPFASIVMTADVIKHTQRPLAAEETHLIFEELSNTAAKSIKLLDGLLCWVKAKKENLAANTQPLFLNDLIHEANGLYLYDQISKNITLYNVIPERQLIYAHKEMLQFINRNILSNATKYSQHGGIIGVTCNEDESWITVAFTDRGNGMTADQLQSLFHLQGNETQVQGYLQSAGMAMSICKDMIEQMNGRIWAESAPGAGTTFYYSLPKKKEPIL
ncbi:MAG: HAMP domain-containing sensor histidine kinase [Bacteroidota bacterium]